MRYSMKAKLILFLIMTAASLNAVVTPNVPDGTPVWADDSDIHVAYVIMGESIGEGDYGQKLVADTISNRMKGNTKTAYELVTEPNQYVGYKEGKPTRYIWKLVGALKARVDIIPELDYKYFRPVGHPLPDYADLDNLLIYKNHVFFNEKQ